MPPLRLLAIIEAYSITGPAKNLLEFARQGRKENILTAIVTFTRGVKQNFFTTAVRDEGIPLAVIEERGPFDPQCLRALQVAAAGFRPDIIQTHAVKSHFLARLAALPSQAPWVAFHHGYTWPTLKTRAYNQLDRWSLRCARKVLTVSKPFRDELAAIGIRPERIEIVHNAILADWGAPASSLQERMELRFQSGIPLDAKVVIIVGRLSREKGHSTLLAAFNRVRHLIRAHLIIVGDGPERSRIEEKITCLGLKNHVTLTGYQCFTKPWYAIADVAVLSSLTEGSPNALLEAMAASIPVVTTAVGGVPEIVTDGESALVVPPEDPEKMSAAITHVLTDADVAARLTKSSSELIRERYTPDARMRKLAGIYRMLMIPNTSQSVEDFLNSNQFPPGASGA